MVKVTMNLTEADAKYASQLQQMLHSRNKAQVVSFALTLGCFLVRTLLSDTRKQLFIRNADGSLDGVLIPELEAAKEAAKNEKADVVASAG